MTRAHKKKQQQVRAQQLQHHISRGSIRRLARRAGCRRVARDVVPQIRRFMTAFVDGVVRDAVAYTEHVGNRRTVSVADILAALRKRGRALYGFDQFSTAVAVQSRPRVASPPSQPPDDSSTSAAPSQAGPIFVILRHGERADDEPDAAPSQQQQQQRPGDPPLTQSGLDDAIARARQIADTCREILSTSSKPLRVVVITSPFLRTLQTAAALLQGLREHGGEVRVSPQVIVDNEMCEVYGPSVIKDTAGSAPVLCDDPAAILGIDESYCVVRGSLPNFSETREVAYSRIRQRFREILQLQTSVVDVLLVVTHGDAVNACVLELHPHRVVYSCDYLGCVFVAKQNSGTTMELQRALGVDWFDE